MSSKLIAVYGVIATPVLEIIDFEKVVSFDSSTRVFGIVVARKFSNEFIYPNEIDEYPLPDLYEDYLKTLIAEAIEFEGDLITHAKRMAWEKRLRLIEPRLMIGIAD